MWVTLEFVKKKKVWGCPSFFFGRRSTKRKRKKERENEKKTPTKDGRRSDNFFFSLSRGGKGRKNRPPLRAPRCPAGRRRGRRSLSSCPSLASRPSRTTMSSSAWWTRAGPRRSGGGRRRRRVTSCRSPPSAWRTRARDPRSRWRSGWRRRKEGVRREEEE